MSAAAVDLHAEAHRLKAELGYGARRIADELGITRHAATLLLNRPLPQPPADGGSQPPAEAAEVAEADVRPLAEVADLTASQRQPMAATPPAHPVRLVINLRQNPALRHDLAVLAQTGCSPEELVDQAVGALAAGYRQAIASGRLQPGPFQVRGVSVRPMPPDDTAPSTPPPRPGPISARGT
ncbi:hypothetical protein AB0G64_09290 [Streptomyces longwoodensis]|uniref:hypothetical protein n=1 Tax=Streptomyces longwoodensis TaxID=68231 RepID=UPI0033DCAB9E